MEKSSVKRLTEAFPCTKIWMDSLEEKYIDWALENGCTGVTTAPTVTTYAIEADLEGACAEFERLADSMTGADEREILWQYTYERVKKQAHKLLPLYEKNSNDGRFAIQADIYEYRNAGRMLEQGAHITSLEKNMIVKLPTTSAGLEAAEQLLYEGRGVMNTAVSSVAQVLAAASAHRRALERRRSEGKDTKVFHAIAMQLRLLDTCVAKNAAENMAPLSENAKRLAAVAVAKKSYRLLRERGLDSLFVLSNFAIEEHWRQMIGGELILTLPPRWHSFICGLSEDFPSLMDEDVPSELTDELLRKSPLFRLAYEEDALDISAIASYPPFARTVSFFTETYEKALLRVRSRMLPDPYKEDMKY